MYSMLMKYFVKVYKSVNFLSLLKKNFNPSIDIIQANVWILQNIYYSGLFFELANWLLAACFLGVMRYVNMLLWVDFYSALSGNSFQAFVNICIAVGFANLFFSVLEMMIDFGVNKVAKKITRKFREGLLGKTIDNGLLKLSKISNFSQKSVSDPDSLFRNYSSIIRTLLINFYNVVGNLFFLCSNGFALYSFGFFSGICFINYICLKLVYVKNGLSDVTTCCNNYEDELRSKVGVGDKSSVFFVGNQNSRSWLKKSINKINKQCLSIYSSKLFQEMILNNIRKVCFRLMNPVATLVVMLSCKPSFPLSVGVVKEGTMQIGLVKQLSQAVIQMWICIGFPAERSVDFANLKSSYDNVKNVSEEFSYNPSDLSENKEVKKMSLPFLVVMFFRNLLVGVNFFVMVDVFLIACEKYLPDSVCVLVSSVFPSIASDVMLNVVILDVILLLLGRVSGKGKSDIWHDLDINIFCVMLSLLSTITLKFTLLVVGMFFPFVFSLPFSCMSCCMFLNMCFSLVHCVLNMNSDLVNRVRIYFSRKQFSSIKGKEDVVDHKSYKNKGAVSSSKVSRSLELACLKKVVCGEEKVDIEGKISMSARYSDNGNLINRFAVVGDNGAGKSSVCQSVLHKMYESGGNILKSDISFNGHVGLPAGRLIVFPQSFPWNSLPLLTKSDVISSSSKEFNLDEVQRMIAYFSVLNSGDSLSKNDELILQDLEKGIQDSVILKAFYDFLERVNFEKSNSTIQHKLSSLKLGVIPNEMSGGETAKFLFALIAGMSKIVDITGERLNVILDEPGAGLDSDSQVTAFKELLGVFENKKLLSISVVIHDRSIDVLNNFDEIICLEKNNLGKTNVKTYEIKEKKISLEDERFNIESAYKITGFSAGSL